ncbi:DUF3854 domain-containing protein [Microcoleus sp. S36a_B3]|uniref:DUF3854 domain-containing protein n=3 Tax=Microcoleus TaxID=44471 RepID=UPI002FD032F2
MSALNDSSNFSSFLVPAPVNPKHLAEWVEGSAVSEAIARLNIESLTAEELNERVRPKEAIKTAGWWCRGVQWRNGQRAGNLFGQAKPDRPHQPKDSKPRKYLTASGAEPDAIFLAMPDRDYWAKVHADTSIPRHWTEGVKKAGAGLSIELATIALTGVWNWGKDGELAYLVKDWAQPGTVHYIDFDSDYAGNKSCRAAILKFAYLLAEHGCEVRITVWDTEFKGMDDFIKANGADAFKEAVADAPTLVKWEKQLKKSDRKNDASNPNISLTPHPRTHGNVVSLSSSSSGSDYIPDTAPVGEQNFVLKAEESLYSEGHWVSIAGLLYRFTGTHYELRLEVVEKRRIRDYLSNYVEMVRSVPRKKYANSASINQVYDWVIAGFAVDPNTINPDGLNTLNGVIKVNPDGSYKVEPHDPKNIYTYVGCKYDPTIDPADCDRLLECLELSQREIFLRTAAAALNLKLVRSKLTGRGVKGLLCHGEGSNGKDTLRAVLAAVYGNGMTGKSLSDFRAYDTGRKFNLSGLLGGVCNWASENTAKVDLDNIQSLKQFITGDPIDIEPKGKDSHEYKPIATFFANCNKLPSITGGTEAIDGRYGILNFEKTYAKNAIASEGQLEADPRFKDDEKFILEQIAPAMLNKMLERWPLLLSEGIDYKATKEAMQKAQEESRHLWQFVRDAGIEVQSGGRIYIKDLWERLQEWYVETGTLEIESGNGDRKDKLIWHDLPNKYDTPVKATNQVFARFSEIFPKIQKVRHTEGGSLDPLKGQFYLSGIVQTFASLASLSHSDGDTASLAASLAKSSEAASEATTITSKGSEASEAVFPTILDFCNSFSKLSVSDKQKLVELLTGTPCSDPLKAFRVGDKVAGNNPEDMSYNWHGRIVEIHTSISCKVDWQEREGMKGGRIISMLFCNLRKI